ncbi:spindle and kinetochore-associated protein 2 isoform X1 [Nannospalax galili]|uniref:spindle and kinetochore-associated protein 2 isoform X1 n=1 Tax=Nannospalax galili TaxID=1026970 RepID=UPI00111C88E8|nr:spindle and kinetochore-associated protein 2 isoform X1 [Nannospalax galili]
MKLKETRKQPMGKNMHSSANPPAAFCVFAQQQLVFQTQGRSPNANGRAPGSALANQRETLNDSCPMEALSAAAAFPLSAAAVCGMSTIQHGGGGRQAGTDEKSSYSFKGIVSSKVSISKFVCSLQTNFY